MQIWQLFIVPRHPVAISETVLYLSGLKKMEGLLTKNNWLRFPQKPKEAKLNIMGGDSFPKMYVKYTNIQLKQF